MSVVGNGREALTQVPKVNPCVVVAGLFLPEVNGIDLVRVIAAETPNVRTIVLCDNRCERSIVAALRAGAASCLLSTTHESEFEASIRAAANGENYISGNMIKAIVDVLRGTELMDPPEVLTYAQRRVFQLWVEGATTANISMILNMSPKTVEAHKAQIRDRLRIHDLPGLVRYAVRNGITSL